MPSVLFRTYKSYSGYLVRGSKPIRPPGSRAPHMEWAFYLLSRLESANWGTAQNYDGAGMSAGPLHAVAVFPATRAQGPLWQLVADVFAALPDCPAANRLREELREAGYAVTHGGRVVSVATAKEIAGEELRTFLSGPRGAVRLGTPFEETARRRAVMFSELFSEPRAHEPQRAYTIRWLLQGRSESESTAYSKYMAASPRVRPQNVASWLSYASVAELGPELDLAMCVYHAFSVNAPAPAAEELVKAMSERTAEGFAKALIRGLGTKDFARWRDTTDNRNRYDRTRIVVESCAERWYAGMVRDLMPENF